MKHKIGAYSLATAMLLMGATPASAGIISIFDGLPLDNIDADGGASTTLMITDTGSIMDLDVALAINNPFFPDDAFISDMTITLSHGGVDVILFNSTGNDESGFMDIVFDDDAPLEVDEGDAATWLGTWQPHSPLSAFDTMDISGAWTLGFMDNSLFTDDGDQLLSWSLIAELPEQNGGTGGTGGGTNPIPVPSTVLLFGLGMAALGLRRQNN